MKKTIALWLAVALAPFAISGAAHAEAPYSTVWTRQFGTDADDQGWGLGVDASENVYISGQTAGNLGGTNAGQRDAYLVKYDAHGTLQWTHQFGTSLTDIGEGIAVDTAGNSFVCGLTNGNLAGTNAGQGDGFLVKYDNAGNQVWSRQFGTSGYDEASSVAIDNLGNVYVSGNTTGSLGGPNAGEL